MRRSVSLDRNRGVVADRTARNPKDEAIPAI